VRTPFNTNSTLKKRDSRKERECKESERILFNRLNTLKKIDSKKERVSKEKVP